jgi:hypothetical protein
MFSIPSGDFPLAMMPRASSPATATVDRFPDFFDEDRRRSGHRFPFDPSPVVPGEPLPPGALLPACAPAAPGGPASPLPELPSPARSAELGPAAALGPAAPLVPLEPAALLGLAAPLMPPLPPDGASFARASSAA